MSQLLQKSCFTYLFLLGISLTQETFAAGEGLGIIDANSLTGTDTGISFTFNTLDASNINAHYLQMYFYDASGSLIPHGVASFIDNNNGATFTNGSTHRINAISLYNLATARVSSSVTNISTIKFYMDNGVSGSSWLGTSNWLSYSVDCASTSNECISADSPSTSWGPPDTTTINRYLYINQNNNSAEPIVMCNIGTNGISSSSLSCSTQSTNTSGINYNLGLAINNGFLYLSSATTSSISYCSIDPSQQASSANSTVGQCNPTGVTSSILPAATTPRGIAFSAGGGNTPGGPMYAYIVSGATNTGAILMCQVPQTGASVGNLCASGTSTLSQGSSLLLYDPRGIAVYNGTAYITNSASSVGVLGNSLGSLIACPASTAPSSISSCSYLLPGSNPTSLVNQPRGVAAYDGYLYFVNNASSASIPSVVVCQISGSSLSGCQSALGSSYFKPNGIAIFNNTAYISNQQQSASTSANTGYILACPIGNSNGTFSSSCSVVASSVVTPSTSFITPVGLAIY